MLPPTRDTNVTDGAPSPLLGDAHGLERDGVLGERGEGQQEREHAAF